MNQRDRQQAAKLIEAEFSAKQRELKEPPTCEQINAERKKILSEARMTKIVNDLRKAEEKVQSLTHELNRSFPAGRYCSDDWEYRVKELAKKRLEPDPKELAELTREKRKLLAKVETCETREQLAAIFQQAGL